MSVNILQVVLFTAVGSALLFITIPWALGTINVSIDSSELNSIKSQFSTCNDRIVETARTGTTNKCLFNVKNGEIVGRTEGVYYRLTSTGPICDRAFLTEIDSRSHIWQECNVTGNLRTYGMLWMFPKDIYINASGMSGSIYNGTLTDDILFGEDLTLRTLTLSVAFEYTSNIAGKIVKISRLGITENNVTLKLDIE